MYLNVKTIAARYEVAVSTIWRWVQENSFPKPYKVNGSTRWRIDDIEQWEATFKPMRY